MSGQRTSPLRLAVWSGPRNLSTALMYSFAARGDCAVLDEPFYAAFLDRTKLEHPMRAEILAAHDKDPARIAAKLLGPVSEGTRLFYQKHMCHHMVPGIPRDWFAQVSHVFLIRHPARVIASYLAKRESPTIDDLGARQQWDLYHEITDVTGKAPHVIDATDIRAAPEEALRRLCIALEFPFTPRMLSWSAGPKPFDGAWAPHWYGAVHASTGFAGAEGPLPVLPEAAQPLLSAAMPHYERLAQRRLT